MTARKYLILGFLGLACLSALILPAAAGAKDIPGRVVSDIDPLQTVIILPPSTNDRKETYNLYEDSPFVLLNYLDGMVQQHGILSALLKDRGVRTLNVADLLDNAVANARQAGMLDSALAEIFPEQFPRLKDRLSRITASAILGRDPDFFFNYDEKGSLDPLIPTSTAFIYTRDVAVSTPRGIILGNSSVKWRKHEHLIGRFLFRFADELKAHPVVFDAEVEGVRCDGGDIIVKDENTLLMGIGNFSQREAASKIARKLNMDVIGVSMPPLESFSGVNFEIMHLDTVFNLVDEKKALTVPYLFLKKYDGDNPLVKYLQAVRDRPQKEPEKGELAWPSSMKAAVESIPKVGWLTLFKAGTGEARDLGTKLGDYLEEQGYEIIPVGGEKGDLREDLYLDDRVLYELSLQAANVVQLGPGKVLAYAHNTHTNEALRRHGVEVLAFEGKYLADSLGGPHCLTMPLVRKSDKD